MTLVTITVEADLRIGYRAVAAHAELADVIEQALRSIDCSTPTLGRDGPAVVRRVYVRTEHGAGQGRSGRGDGWRPSGLLVTACPF